MVLLFGNSVTRDLILVLTFVTQCKIRTGLRNSYGVLWSSIDSREFVWSLYDSIRTTKNQKYV